MGGCFARLGMSDVQFVGQSAHRGPYIIARPILCLQVATTARASSMARPRLPIAGRVARRSAVTVRAVAEPVVVDKAVEAPAKPVPSGGDPWEDEKWTKYK